MLPTDTRTIRKGNDPRSSGSFPPRAPQRPEPRQDSSVVNGSGGPDSYEREASGDAPRRENRVVAGSEGR